MDWKKWSIWAVVSAGLGVVVTKFFDVLAALVGPESALYIVDKLVQFFVIILVAIASIIVSWVVTEVFKRAKYPEPSGVMSEDKKTVLQPSWKALKGRLWLCSITWNFIVNGGFLIVRYQPFVLDRNAFETLGAILIWTAVVCGIGIASYDIFVRKLYHKIMRQLFPTKYVKITKPDGTVTFEERPADQPSDPASEKTMLPDRTQPKPPE